MNRSATYVRIDDEPFLSRAREYRAKLDRCQEAWIALAKEYDATSVPGFLGGLNFSGRTPDGWTKPKGLDGFSKPKKNHPDGERLAVLRASHPMLRAADVFGDAVCWNLSYRSPDGNCWGSGGIGYLFDAKIGWAGETYFGVIPDAEAAVRQHLAEYPDHIIEEPAASWRLPDGLTRLTAAEYRLAYAQYEAEEERARASLSTPSAPSEHRPGAGGETP